MCVYIHADIYTYTCICICIYIAEIIIVGRLYMFSRLISLHWIINKGADPWERIIILLPAAISFVLRHQNDTD